jgi:hypothetical protein
MSDRYANVIVVAEDERSANLLRRYVQHALHVNPRGIRQRIAPLARGDAKQWVLNQYPIEIKELRRGLSHNCLLVHLDADVGTVDQRLNQLSTALANEGMEPRGENERVSLVIARRHTETWLCALTGIQVNEDEDCKRRRLPPDPDRVVKPAAEQLYALTRPNARKPDLPSLIVAIEELRRLER